MRREVRIRRLTLVVLLCCAWCGGIGTHAEERRDEDRTAAGEQGADKQADVLAGHSYHGEVFNEGPRQSAYLMAGTGRVHLPITTENERVQKFFDQGVGQLHGFWYFEAERSFRQAAAIEPGCAMAYWGMAMANHENEKRARGFIDEAIERREGISRREQLWIDGYAAYLKGDSKDNKQRRREYIRSLEAILHEFPEDLEAKAFLVVRLWQFDGDLPISSHQAVDALLDQIFAVEPMHPAHHYRIHLWDNEKPERALGSAARSGQSSPSIAHMWHMGGHIYSRLERYADSAWQQEASARVDHAQMMRDRVLPDQIHNFAHNNEWLIRNLSHIGRIHAAVDLARNMIELPRHPRYNTLERRGNSSSYGRRRLLEVLERYEMWHDLIGLCQTMYLEPTDVPEERIEHHRALGVAHHGAVNLGQLVEQITALEELRGREAQEKLAAAEEAEKKVREEESKKDEETNEERSGDDEDQEGDNRKKDDDRTPLEEKLRKARESAEREVDRRIKRIEAVLAELRALEALLIGAHQLAGERLGEVKGLSKERLALLYLQAGDAEKAEKLAGEAVKAAPKEVVPLAVRAWVLHTIGERKQAAEAFAELRENSAHIDLDAPVFQRLQPLVRELGIDLNWKLAVEPPGDVGDRPDLDSLGPFRWQPPPAPAWRLPGAGEQQVALEDYRCHPVIVIFYLGHGCLHCVEQLQAFAPKTADFEKQGISLVAISTDPLGELTSSRALFEAETKFPFPLVSDAKMEVFRKYRAFDDFENQPLHGTYLVDADGRVLWQDISYEPFTDPEFLLEEARRLLATHVGRVGAF